jgi:hypothetical protein
MSLTQLISGGVVSCNAAETAASTTHGIEEEHQLSGVTFDPHAQSDGEVDLRQLRSLLRVEKMQPTESSVVHYGEHVFITTLPELLKNEQTGISQSPLYLASIHEGLGFTMSQRVFAGSLSRDCGPQNIRWKILPVSSTQCSEAYEPEPVDLSQPVQIVHCATGKALLLDRKQVVYNDFGQELQLRCDNKSSSGRTHVVSKEFKGIRTGDFINAVEQDNWWKLEAWGEHMSEGSGARSEMNAENVTRALACQLGAQGVAKLVSLLAKIDRTGEGAVPVQEFKWSVYRVGAGLSANELDCVIMSYITRDHAGVNTRSFSEDLTLLVDHAGTGDEAETKE